MTAAPDFWTSKTTLAALGTLLTVAGECLLHQHPPTLEQWQMVLVAVFAATIRDTVAKGTTGTLAGQPGAVPVVEPRVSQGPLPPEPPAG